MDQHRISLGDDKLTAMSAEPIVITGRGMRTSVGNCTAQSCAAIRAGINRFTQWTEFTPAGSDDEGDEEPIGVTAAATSLELGDNSWMEKAELLLIEPLHEAIWEAGLVEATDAASRLPTRLYVSTPYRDRLEWTAAAAQAQQNRRSVSADDGEDESDAEAIEEASDIDGLSDDEAADSDGLEEGSSPAAATVSSDNAAKTRYAAFSQAFSESIGEWMHFGDVRFFPHDHAGGAAALASAVADLQAGVIDVAVVAGVDSLLEVPYLEQLNELACLKTLARPIGLIPGEAAAAVVLERRSDASKRNATTFGAVTATALAVESYALGSDSPITASAISEVIRQCLAITANPRHVFVDLNGHRSRFSEWATAETRCMHAVARGWQMHHHADCHGDVGAATVPLTLAIVSQGYQRRYLAGDAMIVVSSLRGERAAISMTSIQPAVARS